MKKTTGVVCLIAGLVFALSGFASAQEALLRGFEQARTVLLAEKGLKDIQPPASSEIEPGHELGTIIGTGIDMKVYDHAFAGAINGAVAFGFFDESAGLAKLTMRKYGQTISAEFKRQSDKSLGGVVTSDDGANKRATSVFVKGIDAANKTIKLLINNEEVAVVISPEGISDGHFVNPTFSTVIGGKPVSYRIEATGCYGYSINMTMMILGAYAH